jgi:5-enolpyruvylshikimate-3-phosphate synthase
MNGSNIKIRAVHISFSSGGLLFGAYAAIAACHSGASPASGVCQTELKMDTAAGGAVEQEGKELIAVQRRQSLAQQETYEIPVDITAAKFGRVRMKLQFSVQGVFTYP